MGLDLGEVVGQTVVVERCDYDPHCLLLVPERINNLVLERRRGVIGSKDDEIVGDKDFGNFYVSPYFNYYSSREAYRDLVES
jgi:hypothetical protein